MDWGYVLIILGVWSVLIALAGVRRVRVLGSIVPKCAACEYDLTGLSDAAVCPECGGVFRARKGGYTAFTYRAVDARRFAVGVIPLCVFVLWCPVLWYVFFIMSGYTHGQGVKFATLQVLSDPWLILNREIGDQLLVSTALVVLGLYASFRLGDLEARRVLRGCAIALWASTTISLGYQWRCDQATWNWESGWRMPGAAGYFLIGLAGGAVSAVRGWRRTHALASGDSQHRDRSVRSGSRGAVDLNSK